MKDECLICSAPHMYSDADTEAECALCHKKRKHKEPVIYEGR